MTTRTSLADRSRGRNSCQLSNTPRRMRSPAITVAPRATKVMTSHATNTRRCGSLLLEPDFKPVIGTDHVEWRGIPREFFVADALLVHLLDVAVFVRRLMVEER